MKIAIIGTGLIGWGWAIVFARGGCEVIIYDRDPDQTSKALGVIGDRLSDLAAAGLIENPSFLLDRISATNRLAEALAGVDYVQECVPERLELKTEVYTEIAAALGNDTVVGSSSSGLPASAFTHHVSNRHRCLVVHPMNPPYLIPVVELVPSPWTDSQAVTFARDLMSAIGQMPVVLTREIEGFLLNRLQGALLREAWALYEDGIASLEDIDRTVSDGLGLRWSFMGPFETIDLNAPDGIADYARRLGPLYAAIAASRPASAPWNADLIERVETERRQSLPADQLADRMAWRDRRLMRLSKWKRSHPEASEI